MMIGIEAARYAKRPVEMNGRPGDHVLVVADFATPQEVVEALAGGASSLGYEVATALCSKREDHGHEPPPSVAGAMKAADLVLIATSTAMAHTEAVVAAAADGTRFIFMEEVTADMLTNGAATADYDEVDRVTRAVQTRWNEGRRVLVTSEHGTHFEASIDGRRSWPIAGRPFDEDWFLLNGCAFPDGECGIAPVEGTANGKVVFDTTVHTVGRLDEPVRLEVESSKIVRMEGGWQAEKLWSDIERTGEESALYCPAEIAIGTNEAARITGVMREDKKLLGAVHIAYGTNADLGGTVRAPIHIDGLIRHPTVLIDDEPIVENGSLRI